MDNKKYDELENLISKNVGKPLTKEAAKGMYKLIHQLNDERCELIEENTSLNRRLDLIHQLSQGNETDSEDPFFGRLKAYFADCVECEEK